MMIMRRPQQGQGCASLGEASVGSAAVVSRALAARAEERAGPGEIGGASVVDEEAIPLLRPETFNDRGRPNLNVMENQFWWSH